MTDAASLPIQRPTVLAGLGLPAQAMTGGGRRWFISRASRYYSGTLHRLKGGRQKRRDETLCIEPEPVVHDAAIGGDHNEPGGSAGAICLHDRGHSVCRSQVSDGMTKGNTQSISSLIFPQTIEGVDFRTLEHGLDGCEANSLIAKFFGECHEAEK